jgi:hypothetical protein
MLKQVFHSLPISAQNTFRDIFGKKVRRSVVAKWNKNNNPVPAPHYVKQDILDQYGKKHSCTTFVESGTYLGDMIEAQRNDFKKLYSIELDHSLHMKAVARFKPFKHITILKGDSGDVLFDLLPALTEKSLFWLDGHYSGGITATADLECPIYKELDAIFNNNSHRHVILIDDARCFNGTHDYPTMQEMHSYLASKDSTYSLTVDADIIRIEPNRY